MKPEQENEPAIGKKKKPMKRCLHASTTAKNNRCIPYCCFYYVRRQVAACLFAAPVTRAQRSCYFELSASALGSAFVYFIARRVRSEFQAFLYGRRQVAVCLFIAPVTRT
ncbi:hypothetical protein NDU88_004769 [Pleurodeles waltl]|uniref:Uncharacterized protein n=1 Tax=Pleurodeles waltl TaxID=8319 RepID=A0AAV7L0D6_PLEWA|nr:hypothetical protein NDU88_004769 [Pleurodeles waltl]